MAFRLRRFISQRVRSARVGDVAGPVGAEDTRALGSIGASAANLGIAFLRQEKQRNKELQVADANREIGVGTGFINQQKVEHQAFAESENDVDLIRADWAKRDKAIGKFIQDSKNPLARQKLGNTFTQNRPLYQGNVEALINDRIVDKARADLEVNIANIAQGDYALEAGQENELRSLTAREGQPAEPLSEGEFKMGKIQAMVNSAIQSKGRILSEEEGAAILKSSQAMISGLEDKRVNDFLVSGGLAQKNDDGTVDVGEAFEFINNTDSTSEQKLAARSDVVQWSNQSKVAAQQEWVATKGETELAWQELLDAGSYKAIIESAEAFNPNIAGFGSEQVDLKQEWIEGADKALKAQAAGEEIILDPSVKSALLDRVRFIMTGAETTDAILLDARKARHFDRTLPQKDFEQVEAAAIRKYETDYGHAIGAIQGRMKGSLLRPDSFGFQASPIRHEIYSAAWQDFLAAVAAEGDKLTTKKMYSIAEGVTKVHEVSEFRVGELETARETELQEREKTGITVIEPGDEDAMQSQVDALPSGAKVRIGNRTFTKD